MRLYPKRLRNIEDLEREKARLRKEYARLDKEDLFSIDGLLGKKKDGEDGKEKDKNDKSSWVDMLPISSPIVSMVIKMALRILSGNKTKKDNSYQAPREKPGKSKLKAIAFEFIGGYLKWKAIELSYKGIRHIIRNRRKKKEEEKYRP